MVQDPDGNVTVRVTIPRPIWLVIERVASDLNTDVHVALRMMFREMAGMFELGKTGMLGHTFEAALKAVRTDNFGAIASGPKIDLSKLHRSNKTKSGFVGVYANGNGFRAMGKRPGVGAAMGEQYIGQFDTAEEAAWRRYLYYKEHGLPYGELEVEIKRWRDRGEQGTDAELTTAILEHAASVGTLHYFTGDEGGSADEAPSNGPGLIGFDDETAARLLDS